MFSSKFSKPISITFLPKHADGIFKLESYKKNQNLNSLERRREHLLLFSRYAVDETSKLLPRKVHTETHYADASNDFKQSDGNDKALNHLHYLSPTRDGAPTLTPVGVCLSGAQDIFNCLAELKFPTP